MYSFISRWFYSTNHKNIGTLYFIFGTFSGMLDQIIYLLIQIKVLTLKLRIISVSWIMRIKSLTFLFFLLLVLIYSIFNINNNILELTFLPFFLIELKKKVNKTLHKTMEYNKLFNKRCEAEEITLLLNNLQWWNITNYKIIYYLLFLNMLYNKIYTTFVYIHAVHLFFSFISQPLVIIFTIWLASSLISHSINQIKIYWNITKSINNKVQFPPLDLNDSQSFMEPYYSSVIDCTSLVKFVIKVALPIGKIGITTFCILFLILDPVAEKLGFKRPVATGLHYIKPLANKHTPDNWKANK